MTQSFELFAAAFAASVFGSMVGLGGGFVLVPILRLVFGFAPAEAAGTSLALVLANSASGSFTYLVQRRVHVRLGLLIALGGLPGSLLGAWAVTRISAQAFDWMLAALLTVVGTDLLLNRRRRSSGRRDVADLPSIKGMSYRVAVLVGFVVGVTSSLFGIGGGVIVVPSLLYFSDLPAHAISATSHFAILLTSPVGLAAHVLQHDIRPSAVVPLVAGGLLGGPVGARLSLRLKSSNLLLLVAIALFAAAGSLILKHLLH
ncbi:MAG: sulfite exporter TauE/SafE family protein [Vulcanimicrobiaceae bacterium]